MTDFKVRHCGHSTALFPYLICYADQDPVLAPNGMAWQLKGEATTAARLIASGQLSTYRDHHGNRCAGQGPKQIQVIEAWQMISPRFRTGTIRLVPIQSGTASAASASTRPPRSA